EQALAIKPTNNPEAYDAYLRGLVFEERGAYSTDLLRKAIDSFEKAVQFDPNFAVAWARLSRAHAYVYFRRSDATDRHAAKKALENAQKLQPNSPETLLASGWYQYHVVRDNRLAKTTFKQVSKMLPGNNEVPFALGSVTRREGNWDESVAQYEKALSLDPRNAELLTDAADTYVMLRQFPAALRLFDRALDFLHNDPVLMAVKAGIYQGEGNLQEAAKLLTEINAQAPSYNTFKHKMFQLRLERNYGEAIRLLQERQTQFHFHFEIERSSNQMMLAWSQRQAGDAAGAKSTAEQARATLALLY